MYKTYILRHLDTEETYQTQKIIYTHLYNTDM